LFKASTDMSQTKTFGSSKEKGPQSETLGNAGGQSFVEFAMVLPLMLLMGLGVIEVAYALYADHLIAKLAREGSNLISRQTYIQDAETALLAGSSAPLNLNSSSGKLIFSAVTIGSSGANNGKIIIIKRRTVGTLTGKSAVDGTTSPPTSSYNGAPDYTAKDSNNDSAIQGTTTLPNGMVLSSGQVLYVTEVFTNRGDITPFSRFYKWALPTSLYAAAFF
jgi:Flp pilus assembly protein TadG